jgi:polar amino acid transport system substrate-binding protein
MKIIAFLYLCIIGAMYSPKSNSLEISSDELTMCIDHYPPLQVILADGQATGENVEVAKAFIQRIGIELAFTENTPFKRCIELLKVGRVDIMVGILDSIQRQTDFHMYLYDDMTVKAFFTRKHGPQISSFSDLKGLNIALLRGVQQSKRFDQAPRNLFNKIEVNSLLAAFSMLEVGRVDAVVCTDYYGEHILNRSTNLSSVIVKSTYTMSKDTPVFIALSKRSKFANYHKKFKKLAKEMFESDEFTKIIFDFKYNHPQYYLEK